MATTTSTDLTVDESTADAGLPLPEPQDADGPIFKQVWQTQTDALDAQPSPVEAGTDDVVEEVVEDAPEAGEQHGGTHSA
ncbi:hypothetical protein [Solicola sp. PLA-1-18]|uniref:hypothetical protein n=1 Tax=Solicola sp. PLA-1-18 TaxID=3380532 RepID=UPI003B80B0A3